MDSLLSAFTEGDYYIFYICLLGVFVVFGSLILRLIENDRLKFLRNDRNLLIVFVSIITIVFGTRGIRIGTDTWNYHFFYFLKGIRINGNIFDFFTAFETDFIFEAIMYLTFPFKNFTLFMLTVSIIMNVSMYKFARKFTDYGRFGSSLLLFLIIASSFVFFSHQVNTIRNGLAIPFILFAIFYASTENYKKAFYFFIVAFLCHRTALIPLACTIFAILGKDIKHKYFIALYVLGVGLSFIGFGFDKLSFLGSIGNADIQSLSFQGETEYKLGFRANFVIYNSIFLFLFFKFSNLKDKTDMFLIKYYILASIVFFFNFNIPFSDRIGVYSWIAIPLLFYSIIRNSYPKKKLYVSSIVTLFYFILNFILIPLL